MLEASLSDGCDLHARLVKHDSQSCNGQVIEVVGELLAVL